MENQNIFQKSLNIKFNHAYEIIKKIKQQNLLLQSICDKLNNSLNEICNNADYKFIIKDKTNDIHYENLLDTINKIDEFQDCENIFMVILDIIQETYNMLGKISKQIIFNQQKKIVKNLSVERVPVSWTDIMDEKNI